MVHLCRDVFSGKSDVFMTHSLKENLNFWWRTVEGEKSEFLMSKKIGNKEAQFVNFDTFSIFPIVKCAFLTPLKGLYA